VVRGYVTASLQVHKTNTSTYIAYRDNYNTTRVAGQFIIHVLPFHFAVAWIIYWFLTALFGIAGIVLYYLYKIFTAKALYYTAYVL